MSAAAGSRPVSRASGSTLRQLAPPLVLGVVAFGLLFHREVAAAVQVWSTSTAFSHCFVVLPLAAFLAWDRRRQATLHPVQPMPWVAGAALPLGLAWLAAERIGVMEGRQLVVMCLVELMFLAVLGWRLWRAFSAALLYLFFLVPFGAFIVPALQVFTTDFITAGLSILGIPYYADAFTIEISAGTFYVAEACAGLRFLIASVAFGVLYACLLYRSPGRRIAFIAASIAVPIIANGFRGLGIVGLGDLLGSAQAAAVDHIVYGWLFFSAVLLVMILVGLPFRQDRLPREAIALPVGGTGGSARPAMRAALAVIVVTAGGPAAAFILDHRAAAEGFSTAAPTFVLPAGCLAPPGGPEGPLDPDHPAVRHYVCSGVPLTVLVAVFPPRTNPAVLAAAARDAAAGSDPDEDVTSTLVEGRQKPITWRLVDTATPQRLTATSLWIDGASSGGGLQARLRQGRNGFFGARHAPMLVAVTVQPAHPGQSAPAALRTFLQAQDTLAAQIADLSAYPRRTSRPEQGQPQDAP